MKKRYPRGRLRTSDGRTITIEVIKLKAVGVFYFLEGEEHMFFRPYHNILSIKYDKTAEESDDE
jgi:hypothetical protein